VAEVAPVRGNHRLVRIKRRGGPAAGPGMVPEVVLVNTAGGLTGGDRLDYGLAVGPGAAMLATTQSAERVYRAGGGSAQVGIALSVGAGAALDWLPQETILFQGGRIDRRVEADLAQDARLTLVETLVLGRAAMGETVTAAHVTDQWRIRRGGRLIHAEALRLSGDIVRATGGPATLRGARAMATLVHIGLDAETRLAPARALIAGMDGIHAAASLRGDVLILRFLAADHAPLRRALARFLAAFRAAPLPRVWIVEEPLP
jgi:urease accessory protein